MAASTLPRTARLTQGRDFNRVFQNASRVSDRYFTVLFRPNGGHGARLGMAVSRRKAPKATDRNRIKRIIRETFRHRRAEIGSNDIIVIPKPAAREATRTQLHRCLSRLWGKVAAEWHVHSSSL